MLVDGGAVRVRVRVRVTAKLNFSAPEYKTPGEQPKNTSKHHVF